MKVSYAEVEPPFVHENYVPVDLTARTMTMHREKVMERIRDLGLDVLIVYGDREHGGNFAYLTGFETRFEESLLVLHADGKSYLLLGNENLKMAQYSFLNAETIHVPHFSLPYQPMEPGKSMGELLAESGIRDRMTVGCAGWKLFTSSCEDNRKLFDLPAFIMDAIRENAPNGRIINAGGIFLDSDTGARHVVNANEIAHYEFGSGLASSRVLRALDEVRPGVTEMEIAEKLWAYGQPTTVTTIVAAGDRFTNAVVFPRNKKICRGDRFSITLGLRGGLTSRAAYVAEDRDDLPAGQKDYIEKVASPYFQAAVTWYEMVGEGVCCGDIYRRIEEILPKESYRWTLNPGHYTGNDEWTASPIYEDSAVILRSGMVLQMDIIPSVPGYAGVGAEDGIAIAGKELRDQLKKVYPETWKRFTERRRYMQEMLGIQLKEEILPMSDICGYLRPLLLNRKMALKKDKI